MTERGPEQQLQGEAADAFAHLEAAFQALRKLAPEMLTDPQLLLSNRLLFSFVQQLESVRLGHLRELDHRPGAIPTSRAGTVAKTFSKVVLKRTPAQACADVKAALALDPSRPAADGGLPELAAAFAEGQVSAEHVKVAVATMSKVPNKFLALAAEEIDEAAPPGLTGGDLIDQSLTSSARSLPPQSTEKVSARLLHMLDPEGFQRFDEHAHERRGLSWSVDSTGMVCGRFTLDPVSGLKAVTVLNALATPRPAREEEGPNGGTVTVVDPRSASQRLADAFVEAMQRAAASILAPLETVTGPALTSLSNPLDATEAPAVAHPAAKPCPTAPAAPPAPAAPLVLATSAAQSQPVTAPQAPPRDTGASGSAASTDRLQTMRARQHPRSLQPRILITTTQDQLQSALSPSPAGRGDPPDPIACEAQHYGPLGSPHLAALACDATLQRVLLAPGGAVLNLGRAVRTVTPTQKLVLAARDRGCVIPGCTLPADWCDAHHVTPWSEGGRSDLDNYALLCTPHHQQVHAGVWGLEMQQGVPWVRPPAWMDPQRRLIRNTFTDHHERAAQLARALTKATATAAQGEPDVRDAA